MKQDTALLYVNGLGTGKLGFREKKIREHWQKAGVDVEFACINWYDQADLDAKIQHVEKNSAKLCKDYDKVILFGSSAGGSLALHCFLRLKNHKVYFVNGRGRLRRGNIQWPDYRKLEWAAHLKTKRPAPVFYHSVILCEDKALPNLTKSEIDRILVLKPVVDFVVPVQTMGIPGAKQHRMFAFGHKWSGYTSIISCRDLILQFATIAK
jgi:hypothetical protein